MLPDVFYVNSSFFPKLSINSKLGFLRIVCRKFLVFWQFTKRFEVMIFECWSRLDSQIVQFRNRNLVCWPIGCTTKFFPIYWRDLENLDYWVLVGKRQMNKSGWKVKVFKWIFSHFRKANVNIPQPCWLVSFWSFQKSEFQTFKRWNEILPHPPYWVMITRALLGNEPTMSFRFKGKS